MSVGAQFGPRAGIGAPRRALVDLGNTVTPSELESIALFASGYSYEEISKIKFLSYFTVRNYITRAVQRSGARNTTHLAALAVQQRIISFNPTTGIFEPVQDLRIAGG